MMAVANSMGFASSFMVLRDIASTPNCKIGGERDIITGKHRGRRNTWNCSHGIFTPGTP